MLTPRGGGLVVGWGEEDGQGAAGQCHGPVHYGVEMGFTYFFAIEKEE